MVDDSNRDPPRPSDIDNQQTLETIYISPSEIEDVLKSLKTDKASGPDTISYRVLYEAYQQLSYPFHQLFNFSLRSKKMPTSWKLSNVCAVYKKGDPAVVNNYRPISLLNTIEKVFERVVFKHIFNFYRDISFFTPSQSGFLPGDSTVNQLAYLYNNFCKALDDGLEVRVVFFDISKAFDKVWHQGLLVKLHESGIRGNVHQWLSDYLTNRRQQVVLPGTMSDCVTIASGVPQGSILGPLLFLVYINDIVQDIGSNINLFADDTSLHLIVETPSETHDTMQNDIQKICLWADKWLVNFNPSKSESMIISRRINKPHHTPFSMYGQQIPQVSDHKHLGVFFF